MLRVQRRGGKQWRKKKRIEERKKAKKIRLNVISLNVGTMTGKKKDLADFMERRRVDILCVQETRWKGAKARCIDGEYKMWYCGSGNKRNGVGIVLTNDYVDKVIQMWKISNEIIFMEMELDGVVMSIISAYALQVGCMREEKEAFWLDLDETVKKIPKHGGIILEADMNEHIGEGNNSDEECMGKQGLRRRSYEEQAVVDFARRMGLAITNTFFVKKQAHKITYSSGGRSTQVDYVIVRRRRIKEMVDTKVVVGECVAAQHRMVVSTMIVWTKWRKAPKAVKKIKWLKLKRPNAKSKFKTEVLESGILGGQQDWQKVAD